MAINRLLTLARRSQKSSSLLLRNSIRLFSASPAIFADSAPPATPAAAPVMPYDLIAEAVKSKLKRLEDTDPRFLRHASPHPALTDHTPILAAPATRVTTLPSGLRVATESNLASRTATVGVWIDAGSRFETDETNGTAHFLEHMIFKGTEKRSVRVLEEEIENMGGHLNAYTSREQTTYYAKVLDKDVPKALDILADILQNSSFNEDQIRRERDVILREMQEWGTDVEAQTEEVIFDHLHATAFQYTPLGRTILGPAQNIKTITKEHLQKYISTHYTAPRMVSDTLPDLMIITASGAVKHEDIVEQVKKLFAKLSTDSTTAAELVAQEPAIFTGSEVRIIDDDVPLAQFAIAFSGASWTDPDSIALLVMQYMLGSWNKNAGGGKHAGSELVQRVGIDDIAESIMAFNTNYKDTGLFGVYAVAKNLAYEQNVGPSAMLSVTAGEIFHHMWKWGENMVPNFKDILDLFLLILKYLKIDHPNCDSTGIAPFLPHERAVFVPCIVLEILFNIFCDAQQFSPDCLDDLSYAIMYEISKLSYRVSDADVIRACNQLKSSILLHLDGTSPVAEDIGRQLLTYGRRIPIAELFARIDAVDARRVKRVANRFIFDRVMVNFY
ncbi:hypothetical protein ACLOJK_003946 [Asimina triloba]